MLLIFAENDFVAFYGVSSSNPRCKWKSKYTPLTRRNEDIQKKKQQEFVEQLLVHNITIESNFLEANQNNSTFNLYEITSNNLQRYFVPDALLFSTNSNDIACSKNIHAYYTNNLFEASTLEAGALLRDWNSIPGRDYVFDCIPGSFQKIDRSDTENLKDQNSYVKHNNETTTCMISTDPAVAVDEDVKEPACSSCQSPAARDSLHSHEEINIEAITNNEAGQYDSEEDLDKTLLFNDLEIQQKLDVINSHLRNSQQLESDRLSNPDDGNKSIGNDIWREQIQAGSQSPDLFDDFEMEELERDVSPGI